MDSVATGGGGCRRAGQASALGLAALLLAGLLAGCEDKRRHQPTQKVNFSEPTIVAGDAPAIDVARLCLDAIIRAQRARRDGLGIELNRQAYESAIGQLLALASRKEIHEQVAASRQYPRNVSEEVAVTAIVESWVSTLAHYVDGLDPATAVLRSQASAKSSLVYVEARNPADVARLAKLTQSLKGGSASAGVAAAGGGGADEAQLREAATRVGLNPPLASGIELRLTRAADRWRLAQIRLVAPGNAGLASKGSTGAGPAVRTTVSQPNG